MATIKTFTDLDFIDDGFTNIPVEGMQVDVTTSTVFQVTHPITGVSIRFEGSGFIYRAGDPIGSGTVNTITFTQNGNVTGTFTGIAWNLGQLIEAIDAIDMDDNYDLFDVLVFSQPLTLDGADATGGLELFEYGDIQPLDSNFPVTIIGSDQNDLIIGSPSNDVISSGNNTSFEDIFATGGNDTYDFGDIDDSLGGGYLSFYYGLVADPITVTLNGGGSSGSMSVSKGASGSDTVLNIADPLNAGISTGGLGLYGTVGADTFNITLQANQWMQVGGGDGVDTYNISTVDRIRVDLVWDGANGPTEGAVVDIDNGGILNDGFGNADILNASRSLELRLTDNNDTYVGGSGNDSVILRRGNDTADGGDGFDRIRYDRSRVEGVDADLEAGTVTGIWRGDAFMHTIANFEDFRGSREAGDTISGSDNDDRIDGRQGDDTIMGEGGRDELIGNTGNDTVDGGQGNDELYGGSDNDLITAGAGNDQAYGGDGVDDIDGGKGSDNLYGGAGNDDIGGASGADSLSGGDNNDVLRGSGGDDTLWGGEGSDTLLGNNNRDVLYGGAGDDELVGSQAADE
ncbi:MAG: calcium-binding protein, partial [Pseudomonadota bacterium]